MLRHNCCYKSFIGPGTIRHSSIKALQSSLHQELTTRPPNRIFDYLSPVPSHLLNITLSDFLPDSCQPLGFSKTDFELPVIESSSNKPLPQGHHLVYFSPQVPSSGLLPDGTDYLQSPGSPYDRRMWAGGALGFNAQPHNKLTVDNGRVCCTESISNVAVRGVEGDEKIFVTIERRISKVLITGEIAKQASDNGATVETIGQNYLLPSSMIEERNLVYFRQKAPSSLQELSRTPVKILKRGSHYPQ